MDDLPGFDDDIVQENEEYRRKKEAEKERRAKLGIDDRVEGPSDGLTAEEVAALTPEQREARWGFTHAELDAAVKVVTTLYSNPALYVGDPALADARLYHMISRDRKTKRENKDTFKQVQNHDRARKQRQQRQEDLDTIKKTMMKQEREAALNALLLPPPEDDEVGLITDGTEKGSAAGTGAAASEAPLPAGAEATSEPLTMNRVQKCHTCKNKYTELHNFYYSLCRPCGDFNFQKRSQTRDLRGKVVLLTGARIKIGYAMAVSLLRCGATLIATTRFVHDCLNRFMTEPDYDAWADRVHLFAVDFRDLWMTTQFCFFIRKKFPKIFAIVNNAAQTIARTPEYTAALRYYEANPSAMVHDALSKNSATVEWMSFFLTHSSVSIGQPMKLESHPLDTESAMNVPRPDAPGATPLLKAGGDEAPPVRPAAEPAAAAPASSGAVVANASSGSTEVAVAGQFPKPRYDRYDTAAEASDTRNDNSWTLNMGDVEGGEAAEVMAINGLAPFIINSKLKPALTNRDGDDDPKEPRFIINVSAMEGQFYRYKQTTHPHTNMAKAALNMMTRTSAPDYARDCIFMNAVDTGWITDESPVDKKKRRADEEKLCPLDEVDAAARCLDPIYTNSTEHGKFYKDYHEIPW